MSNDTLTDEQDGTYWIRQCISRVAECGGSDTADEARKELAALQRRQRDAGEAADAARFRWLTDDHADRETRELCRRIIDAMGVRSYSATSAAIDAAMRQEAE